MKRFKITLFALSMAAGAMFSSCVENSIDDLQLHDKSYLDFSTTEIGWNDISTRAEEESQVLISELEGDDGLEQPLYLHITSEDRKAPTEEDIYGDEATRGTPASTDNFIDLFGDSGFGLFAYVYDKGSWDAASSKSDYIHNLPVPYRENTGMWHIHEYAPLDENNKPNYNPTDYYYWPGKNYNVRFYAYAPHNTNREGYIVVPDAPYEGVPSIDIILSNVAASQFNFCVAKSDEVAGDYNATQPLNFKHAMCAISFVTGEGMPEGKITRIEFANIRRGDTFNLETQTWNNVEIYSGSKVVGLTKDIPVTGEADQLLNSESETFLMIPHTLGSNARFNITFVDVNGTSHNLKGSLAGVKWEMGKHYTYKIGASDEAVSYVLTVTEPSKRTDDYLGGEWCTWTLASYKTTTFASDPSNPITEPTEWYAEFSTDDGNTWTTEKPDIFVQFTTNQQGSVEAKPYGTNIAPIIPDDPNNPFGQPIDRTENTSTVNLYTQNGKSTANCYVVNQAGTYTFPLIYGNAIKNGAVNSAAYTGVSDVENVLSTFPDYLGNAISSPYIHNSGTVKEAKLLWMDEPGLVTEVSLSSSSQTMTIAGQTVRYITFRVPKENIAPGNAVIALYDSDGKIMWSWHIWVTTWNGGYVSTTRDSKTYNFATVDLGYAPSRNITWEARSARVRFVQRESGKIVAFANPFEQTGYHTENREGNTPYYQWGRKDPMLPFNYFTTETQISTSGYEKPCYSSVLTKQSMTMTTNGSGGTYAYSGYFGVTLITGSSSSVTIAQSIQNPHVFYARHKSSSRPYYDNTEYDWCNQGGLNRWDADNTAMPTAPLADTQTIKTIYDPSPAGWCVPPSGAFGGLVKSAGVTDGHYEVASGDDNTWSYHIQGLVFPITGDRNRYNGAPWISSLSTRNCELWTSTPTLTTKTGTNAGTYNTAAFFANSSSQYFDLAPLAKSSGFAVRCLKE